MTGTSASLNDRSDDTIDKAMDLLSRQDAEITKLRAELAEARRGLAEGDSHVAWLRFKIGNDGRPTTIHLCDSDAPGAFKVYRRPAPVDGLRARLAWTRDRWDDIVADAETLVAELGQVPMLLGIKAVAENERFACDAALAKAPAVDPYAVPLRAALERIAACGPFHTDNPSDERYDWHCRDCGYKWGPEIAERHSEACAYVIARDALADNSRNGGFDSRSLAEGRCGKAGSTPADSAQADGLDGSRGLTAGKDRQSPSTLQPSSSGHKGGCPALGGYGTDDRTCICGYEIDPSPAFGVLLRWGTPCEGCGKPVHPPLTRYDRPAQVAGNKIWHGACFPADGVGYSTDTSEPRP